MCDQEQHIVWNTQSKNSSESMPLGGGDIGANVWVENDQVFLYLQQSGWFDENNSLLKAGRIRIQVEPNPFHTCFEQLLMLLRGSNFVFYGADKGTYIDTPFWSYQYRTKEKQKIGNICIALSVLKCENVKLLKQKLENLLNQVKQKEREKRIENIRFNGGRTIFLKVLFTAIQINKSMLKYSKIISCSAI